MHYIFDTGLAERYGVDEAIVLNNLIFWISKNKANEKHFYEGKYWTYNSKKAYTKLFPFWSEGQLKRIFSSLIKNGIITVGNFNKSPLDRTNWYSLVDERLLGMDLPEEPVITDRLISTNVKAEIDRPIPDVNTNINTNITSNIKNEKIDKSISSAQPKIKNKISEQGFLFPSEITPNLNVVEKEKKEKEKKKKLTYKDVMNDFTEHDDIKTLLFGFINNIKAAYKYTLSVKIFEAMLIELKTNTDNNADLQREVIKNTTFSCYRKFYNPKQNFTCSTSQQKTYQTDNIKENLPPESFKTSDF